MILKRRNPKVKVKVVNVPNGGEVLKTRVLAGDVPDVVNIYPQSIELQEWAKAGVFEDLSNKDYLKRVKNGYAEKYAVNGKSTTFLSQPMLTESTTTKTNSKSWA